MPRLRTPTTGGERALTARSARAPRRIVGQAHDRIRTWAARLAAPAEQWSPPVPSASVRVEGEELYTQVERHCPAHASAG